MIYKEQKLNGLLFLLFQAWGCSNFVENCSNFVEKSFRDDGLCQDAEPISELYVGGLGDADHHTMDRLRSYWYGTGGGPAEIAVG